MANVEMPKELDTQLLRQDIAVSLYFHGKKKQEDGYLTSDEFSEKLLDRKQKRRKTAA